MGGHEDIPSAFPENRPIHSHTKPPTVGDIVIRTWYPVTTQPVPVGWTVSKDYRFIWKVWTEGDIWPIYFDGAYVVLRPDNISER